MPGTTTLTIANEALSLNLFHQVKEIRDTRAIPYPVTESVVKNAERINDPGERIIVRWNDENHSVASRVQTGYEGYTDFAQPVSVPGFQNYGFVVQPIFISVLDELRNNGGVLPVLEQRVRAVERQQALAFQQVIMRGALASGTWVGVPAYEDFNSWNGADQATGIIEDNSPGTNTLHNLAKTNYPVAIHPNLHNDYFDAAGDASANLLNMLYAANVKQQLKSGDPSSKQEWWASEAAYNNLKQSLRSFEQYVSDGNMDDGKRVVGMYGGVKITPIVDMPTTGSGSTTNPWSMVRVNHDAIRFKAIAKWFMDHTGFQDLPGRVGTRVSLVRLGGNTVCLEPGKLSLIVDGEVF